MLNYIYSRSLSPCLKGKQIGLYKQVLINWWSYLRSFQSMKKVSFTTISNKLFIWVGFFYYYYLLFPLKKGKTKHKNPRSATTKTQCSLSPTPQHNLLRQEMLQSLILFLVRTEICRIHDFYMLFVWLAEQHEAQTWQSHQRNMNILSLLDKRRNKV